QTSPRAARMLVVLGIPSPQSTSTSRRYDDMKLNILIAGLCMTVADAGTGRVFAEPIEPAAKEVMIDGEVIRYEPGQVIVIRGADNKEVVYALAPTALVPAEVTV